MAPSPSLRERKKEKTPPPTPSNPLPAYTTQLSSLSAPLGDDGNVNLNRVMLKEHYLAWSQQGEVLPRCRGGRVRPAVYEQGQHLWTITIRTA